MKDSPLLRTIWQLIGYVVVALTYVFGLFLILDPLTIGYSEFSGKRLTASLLLLAFPALLIFGSITQKRWNRLIVVGIVFGLCTAGVLTNMGGLLSEPHTADAQSTLSFMEGRRLDALTCLAAGKDLIDPTNQTRSGYMCKLQLVLWTDDVQNPTREPSDFRQPHGWRYRDLEDGDVKDGTFTFSMISRRGEIISCTQEACTIH